MEERGAAGVPGEHEPASQDRQQRPRLDMREEESGAAAAVKLTDQHLIRVSPLTRRRRADAPGAAARPERAAVREPPLADRAGDRVPDDHPLARAAADGAEPRPADRDVAGEGELGAELAAGERDAGDLNAGALGAAGPDHISPAGAHPEDQGPLRQLRRRD